MDAKKLVGLIDKALTEADSYVVRCYHGNEQPMLNTKRALHLLKLEAELHPENINERVLRAMHDIDARSVKEYENCSLGSAIGDVTSALYYELPNYKFLTPLRMDYGKGDPI